MPQYRYSRLSSGPNSIRLLRLMPHEDETADIQCELFEYSLQDTCKGTHLYEALSYVWGNPNVKLPIFIHEHCFDVTANLRAALLRLRNHSMERMLWIDAICIDQDNPEEKEHQIQSMAKIYGQATRVIVWLGEEADDSHQVLEDIRVAADDESTYSLKNEKMQEAFLALLRRPWFQRIWVLQEVAAARHILIMCGSAVIDGYAFCLGLSGLELPDIIPLGLQSLIRSVTYLIRGAIFRPKCASSRSGKVTLEIRSLGELIDMYHTRKATLRHDKVYALFSMSSDDLSAAGLSPDYTVSWEQQFQNLVKFLLCKEASVETWGNREIAVIKSKGYILGRVSLVENDSARYDRQNAVITFKNPSEHFGGERGWSTSWPLQASAKSIRQGDLVCLLQGAPKPTIIRTCEDHFAIIMIAVTPRQDVRTDGGYAKRQGLFHSVNSFLRDFLLVWNWESHSGDLQDQGGYEISTGVDSLLPKYLNTDSGKPTRLRDVALILEDSGEYEGRRERFREAIKVLGPDDLDVLTSMNDLASKYMNQGQWKGAEELFMQVIETRKRVLGKEHLDTLISMNDLASKYMDQGQWKEAEELFMQVIETRKRVLGKEHPDTLISINNLALTYRKQGQWKKVRELFMYETETRMRVLGEKHLDTLISINDLALKYKKLGQWKKAGELFIHVIKTKKRVLGEEHLDTLTSMHKLASTYRKQELWKEAKELFMQVIETRKRVLGEEHPDTLTSKHNLALMYVNQGQWKEAEELLMQVAETFKRVLRAEHPYTLTSMASLALAYLKQGRWKEAEELGVQVMETRKRVLGEEHPGTLTSMASLEFAYRKQGWWKEAEELRVQLIETRKRVLGEEHPDTLTSIANLASMYMNQGRRKDVQELEVQAMETRKRICLERNIQAG